MARNPDGLLGRLHIDIRAMIIMVIKLYYQCVDFIIILGKATHLQHNQMNLGSYSWERFMREKVYMW